MRASARQTDSAPARTAGAFLKRWTWLVLGALVVLVALCAIDVLRIKRELDAGQDALAALDLHTVDQRGGVANVADQAAAHLDRAAQLADDSRWLSLLDHVPILGNQSRGVRDLTRAAAEVGGLSRRTAHEVQTALDATHGPDTRVRLIDAVNAQLVELSHELPTVDVGASGFLLPPLSGAREKFVQRLAKAQRQLDDGISLTRTLRSFLVGPRRYLVLAGNNSEMRGGGITTTAGLAKINNGTIDVSGFLSTGPLFLLDPHSAPVPPDLQQLYGWMNIGKEWRTVDTSPNFPSIAPIYASMSEQSPLGAVDGVIFVDIVTLQRLLGVIGPVTVDGVTYSTQTVTKQLLHENYLKFGTADSRFDRYDAQSKVATAIFEAMNLRSFSIPAAAAVLADAAKGRHLQAWSGDPDEQILWEKLGADGALDSHQLGVLVTNVSANKLDYLIDPTIEVTTTPLGTDRTRVHMRLTITNPRRDPNDTSPYIEGGSPGFVDPGDHRTYVLFYLPTAAYNIGNADPGFITAGNDGPATVGGMIYIVPQGSTKTVDVSFTLPNSDTKVELLPSARLRPERYTINGKTITDAVPIEADLEADGIVIRPP
ncbi:MAG: hypothetical protein QOI95_1633 [Acidimicrobiaceae bacterium]